jgi:ribosomal protein L40E
MSYEFIRHHWLAGFIILAVFFYFFAVAGYRVQEDAKKRGMGIAAVTFWSFCVVFFGPIFLPLYLIFRARSVFAATQEEKEKAERYRLCPHCGTQNPADAKVCEKCHKVLDSLEAAMGKKICPECGAENPVEAYRCKVCSQVIGYIDTDEDS